jgi:CheY-like chemotaxis protein
MLARKRAGVFTHLEAVDLGLCCLRVSVPVTKISQEEEPILLIDDNEDDILLIKRAFERAGLQHPVHSVRGGAEGMAYLNGERPYGDRLKYPVPALVLLDIKMPRIDGFDVLKWIRAQQVFSKLCVVMLTSSDEIRDVNLAYQLGATSFLVKPLDFWNAGELSRSLGLLLARSH